MVNEKRPVPDGSQETDRSISMFVDASDDGAVEAETADEARALLAAGHGYCCHIGDRLHLEVEKLVDAASFGGRAWVGRAAQ